MGADKPHVLISDCEVLASQEGSHAFGAIEQSVANECTGGRRWGDSALGPFGFLIRVHPRYPR
jgi:hypothetical protein